MIVTDKSFFILVVNVGSTSYKFKLYDMSQTVMLATGRFERIGCASSPYEYVAGDTDINGVINTESGFPVCINMTIELLLHDGIIGAVSEINAVAFKTVMCPDTPGTAFISEELLNRMNEYTFAAPAHNPQYLAAIRAFMDKMPNSCFIAAFESEFHSSIPEYARIEPIKYELAEKYKIKKYGYHGASHAYVAQSVTKAFNADKIISCHLGGSSSVCAIKNGKSIDTSMSFSPQSGVFSAERTGDFDSFAVLYIMEREGLSPKAMRNILASESGLLGISGISGDMRDLSASDSDRAAIAMKAFAYSVKKYLGAYLAVLDSVDVISFSGGIGENSGYIRQLVTDSLENLGIIISTEKNKLRSPSEISEISAPESKIKVCVTPTNEELIVAQRAFNLIQRSHIAEM